jgi:hypothetical protein
MDRNFDRTLLRIKLSLKDYYEPTDRAIFREMLLRAASLPADQQIPVIKKMIVSNPSENDTEKAIESFLDNAYARSELQKQSSLMPLFKASTEELEKIDDPFIQMAVSLYPIYQELREEGRARRGKMDKLFAKLIDVKKDFLSTDFIPDANSTLRLTFGYIRGYHPTDAVYKYPITSTVGILEKTTGIPPFDPPQKLLDLIRTRDFGRFELPKLKGVPVGILYNMDTTGGNSGSPVLNSRGQLVGLNFDRAFEATINDYAWNELYSRSIAVDIRYILWITEKFGNADYLLREMEIN